MGRRLGRSGRVRDRAGQRLRAPRSCWPAATAAELAAPAALRGAPLRRCSRPRARQPHCAAPSPKADRAVADSDHSVPRSPRPALEARSARSALGRRASALHGAPGPARELEGARLQHPPRRHPAPRRGPGRDSTATSQRSCAGRPASACRSSPARAATATRATPRSQRRGGRPLALRGGSARERARNGGGGRAADRHVHLAHRTRGVVPSGSCPSVGIAGLALGGGHGLAGRRASG